MRLTRGQGNGVSLAGRPSQSIARIARVIAKGAVCRTFLRSVLLLVVDRQ